MEVHTLCAEASMKVLLKSLGFNPGPSLQRHVTVRISSALAHWADRVGRAVVRIADANGPRGGLDKVCSIHLLLPNRAVVVVTAVATDYYGAVDLAVRRACRAVAHAIERRPRGKGVRPLFPEGDALLQGSFE